MFQLDDDFLQSVGLGAMPAEQKEPFLEHLLETLELRVGTKLSEGMTDEQLAEFEKLVKSRDYQGALAWLGEKRPDFKKVVADELETIKKEVEANKSKILGK
jgi:hypothetical protein